MSYSYIDTDILLQPLLAQINLTPTLLLDTEFIRVSTYFPKLGLLQLHLNSVDYLIDPLALNNIQSLWDSLFADNKLFIFHSCKEDLDVLQTCTQKLPTKVFDTQVAAAFLGYGPSLGYAGLVEKNLPSHCIKRPDVDRLASQTTDRSTKTLCGERCFLFAAVV